MHSEHHIDDLDRHILRFLQQDSRTPFLEIARQLDVSGGTIHGRVKRMKELGIITGSRITVDHKLLGYHVMAFIGVVLVHAGSAKEVIEALRQIPEVTDVHFTTGNYALLVKIAVTSIDELYRLIAERLQDIHEIQSTETFVILDTPIQREVSL